MKRLQKIKPANSLTRFLSRSNLAHRPGFTFLEVVIAFAILVMCLVPVTTMFSTSGRAVQKSQNLGLAVGLAHRISQYLMAMPFSEIREVPLPGFPLADGPDDPFFNPIENWGVSSTGNRKITNAQQPSLHGFLTKFNFRYALIVNNVTFGVGDEMKSVGVVITWREGGKDLLYKMQVYVPNL